MKKSLTKSEAIRKAIRDGFIVPAEGVARIKERHGLDVTTAMFSTIKSKYVSSGTTADANSASTSGEVKLAGKSAAIRANGGAELARQVKALIDTYGASEVKGMLAVLS